MKDMPQVAKVESVFQFEAQIISGGQLAKGLSKRLNLQGIFCTQIKNPQDLNPVKASDYIFWFIPAEQKSIPEVVINTSRSFGGKIILISQDCSLQPKLLDELKSRQINACGIEIYDLYGPKTTSSPFSLLWSKIKHNDLLLPENDQLRVAPLYIDDALDAVLRVAFTIQTYSKKFVFTGNQALTLLNLSFRLREEYVKIMAKTPRVVQTDKLFGHDFDINQIISGSKRCQKELDWKPQIDLDRGLSKTIISSISSSKAIFPTLSRTLKI